MSLPAADGADVAPFQKQIVLIPQQLTVLVHFHDVETVDGPVRCWTYVTDGYWAAGHPELSFTLRLAPGENPYGLPEPPLRLFHDFFGKIGQGQRVLPGERLEMAADGFLGLAGLALVRPYPLPGITLSAPTLATIGLGPVELEAVQQLGITRVLARLGKRYSSFPYPLWTDRGRPQLDLDRDLEKSALTYLPTASIPNLFTSFADGTILLRGLLPATRFLRARLSALPEGERFALLTEYDLSADSQLVWEPDNTITNLSHAQATGSRIGAGFCVLIPGREWDEGQRVEDGYAMLLTAESWQALRLALVGGAPLHIPAVGGGYGLRLEWLARPPYVYPGLPQSETDG